MPRRLALRLLIAWLAWVPLVSAQMPAPQGYSGPYFQGPAAGNAYPGPSAPGGYQLQPTLYDQLIPASSNPSYDMDPLHDLGLAETLSRSWFRTEYLWLNYRDPRDRLIGAKPAVPVPGSFDINTFVPALDRVTGVRTFQDAYYTTFAKANNQDNSGLRLTFGIPTQLFTFEASGFALGESQSQLNFPLFIDVNSILGNSVIPAIPLQRDGLPSDQDLILFDQGMNLNLTSNLQGTDLKFVLGALTPNVATEVAPIVGFNYVHFSNRMTISGDDSGSNTSHLIDSQSNNNIFGPEIGMRMETRGKWITLGFEPKFTFGINRMSNRLHTSQIFSSEIDPDTLLPVEPDRFQNDTLTRFSPMLDLSTYARVHLAEHLSLSFGYQFMATNNVSVSQENVVWNSSSDLAAPPLINLRQNRQTFWLSGINLGLEWQF